jgi:hypothetical protein
MSWFRKKVPPTDPLAAGALDALRRQIAITEIESYVMAYFEANQIAWVDAVGILAGLSGWVAGNAIYRGGENEENAEMLAHLVKIFEDTIHEHVANGIAAARAELGEKNR